ncbi:MAG: TetR/AcrR family transcriptional regulator [Rhizobiales bacterium]|nr:TetR/AcrR family transcriptional regulator [Hyphomicrobiales bacterium]
MVGRPQKRTQETRDNIIKIAEKLFDKSSFDHTSVEEIANKAQIAKATIFAHFGDKTNLLIAIKIKKLSTLIKTQSKENYHNEALLPHEILLEYYKPWLKIFRENPDFAHLYLMQSTLKGGKWTDEFVAICCKFEQLIQTRVEALIEEQRVTKLDDPYISTQALQAFYFHVLALYKGGYMKDQQQQEDLLASLIYSWFK